MADSGVIAEPQQTRFGRAVTPLIEYGVLAAALAMVGVTYAVVRRGTPEALLSPSVVALLLVANLIPWMALLVLLGRRVARSRAARSPIGGSGRLHVRLVALFSVLASVPMLFVTVFASLLFQYGVEFWYSDRARDMIERAASLANDSYVEMTRWVDRENIALAKDIANVLSSGYGFDTPEFVTIFGQSVLQRSLAESIVFSVSPQGEILTFALLDPYERGLAGNIRLEDVREIQAGKPSIVRVSGERVDSLAPVPGTPYFVASGRVVGARELMARKQRAEAAVADYRALRKRSRDLQLNFNLALIGVSLLIVGLAVFVALAVADRLVRPVGALVDAAGRIAGGDLDARVADVRSDDEIGTLANAFNQMTGRLQEQTNALVTANAELESRRALIEAVMSGVSAGIVSIDEHRHVRLLNASAQNLLRTDAATAIGHPLSGIAPELDRLVAEGARDGVAQIVAAGEARTLAVKITRDEDGRVLTFDDITQQLLDQRRAAWSDVARRIAHEIKNPLTPIQLAAERLQRRYGRQLAEDDGVFGRLTETIVRQVGDLRRMVDEFSSFARMPKPVFRDEALVDIARQAVFLHEVAHGEIAFSIDAADPAATLVCDRRQLGQALTNIVKNAVEAIEARPDDAPPGRIAVTIAHPDDAVEITVSDNGVGLPVERDRIIEPYMTTRARGTGLGLAIVKKIVEEHFGTMAFADNPGGGTIVNLRFDPHLLAGLAGEEPGNATEDPSPRLTRTGA